MIERIKREHAADPRFAFVLFSEDGHVLGAVFAEYVDEALSAVEGAVDAVQLVPARCHDCGDEGDIIPEEWREDAGRLAAVERELRVLGREPLFAGWVVDEVFCGPCLW